MTSENNDNFSSPDHFDDGVSENNDELLSNLNRFEFDNSHLNARRKIENYFDEKILLNQLQDVFTDDLD